MLIFFFYWSVVKIFYNFRVLNLRLVQLGDLLLSFSCEAWRTLFCVCSNWQTGIVYTGYFSLPDCGTISYQLTMKVVHIAVCTCSTVYSQDSLRLRLSALAPTCLSSQMSTDLLPQTYVCFALGCSCVSLSGSRLVTWVHCLPACLLASLINRNVHEVQTAYFWEYRN